MDRKAARSFVRNRLAIPQTSHRFKPLKPLTGLERHRVFGRVEDLSWGMKGATPSEYQKYLNFRRGSKYQNHPLAAAYLTLIRGK